MMDILEIQKMLPHRYPFLLIDRVLEIKEGESITAIKNVSINEHYFQGHFPGQPVMPGVLQVEAMAQAGGIMAMSAMGGDAADKVMYFMSIDKVKFRKPVVPGDQLIIKVVMTKLKGKIATLHGDCFVGEKKVCEADMMAMITER